MTESIQSWHLAPVLKGLGGAEATNTGGRAPGQPGQARAGDTGKSGVTP